MSRERGDTDDNDSSAKAAIYVSTRSIEVRLQQLGLSDARYRCRFPRPAEQQRTTYYRSTRRTTGQLQPEFSGIGTLHTAGGL